MQGDQCGEHTLHMQDIGSKLIPTWQFDSHINNSSLKQNSVIKEVMQLTSLFGAIDRISSLTAATAI